jgi:tetratricopeptide (TPR) repeat protein
MKMMPGSLKVLAFVVIILVVFPSARTHAQDPQTAAALHEQVAPLLFEYQLERSLEACSRFDASDLNVIAYKSATCSLMGNRDKDEDLIAKGFSILEPYQARKDNHNILVALALSYGTRANQAGLKEKISLSEKSIQHCEEALAIDPDLPHPNFILGRYYYELSDMNKMTAKLAKSMLGEEVIERASFDLALSYLEKSSEQRPTRFLYNYYTGAAHEKLGNKEKAMQYYRLADRNERHNEDDRKADKDLRKKLR